jgi:hypothetical protein
MTSQHPITPPPELVEQWRATPEYTALSDKIFIVSLTTKKLQDIATQAARWGADQELEACVEWVRTTNIIGLEGHETLRAARRPKPPSLKEQALTALHAVATGANDTREQHQDLDTIRRALEQLNDE